MYSNIRGAKVNNGNNRVGSSHRTNGYGAPGRNNNLNGPKNHGLPPTSGLGTKNEINGA